MKTNRGRDLRGLFPEDVVAILDLFPDMWLNIGAGLDYFDVHNGDHYVFIQPIPGVNTGINGEQNKKRFISWVRAGMPEGHNTYSTTWEKEE